MSLRATLNNVKHPPKILQRAERYHSLKFGAATPQRFAALNSPANIPKALPFSVTLARNEVYSRFFIELFGYYSLQLALARNKFERYEETFDTISQASIGTALPVIAAAGIRQQLKKAPIIQKSTPKIRHNPLDVGLEDLLPKRFSALKPSELGPNAREALRQKLVRGRLAVLISDLFLMATAAQLFSWGKNWLTQKLSGKRSFAGTLTWQPYETPEQKAAAKSHQASERKRFWTSLALGYGGNLILPLAIAALLRKPWSAKTAIPKEIDSTARKALGLFNSTDGVFYSKYTLMWSTLFNDTISTVLSARDQNEKREYIAKYAAINLFYFVGDDIIAGQMAKQLQKKHQKALKGIKLAEKGILGLPSAVRLDALYTPQSTATASQKLAYTLGKRIFWTGLVGTTLCLGASLTIVNNLYTFYQVAKANPNALDGESLYARAFKALLPAWPRATSHPAH